MNKIKNLILLLIVVIQLPTAYGQLEFNDLEFVSVELNDTLRFDFDGSGEDNFEIIKGTNYIKVRPLMVQTEHVFENVDGWVKTSQCSSEDTISDDLDFDWVWNSYPWFPALGFPPGWGTSSTYKVPYRIGYPIADPSVYKYGYLEFDVDELTNLTVRGWYINHTFDERVSCDSDYNDDIIENPLSVEEYINYSEMSYDVYNMRGQIINKSSLPSNVILIKVYENGNKEKFVICD
tara:strand:- start:396 stop:1100 length:705 start_codon:yes stop_codon:yes gene_type:complete